MTVKNLLFVLVCATLAAFTNVTTLKGVWVFQGGVYNGVVEGVPKGYTLQRNYTDKGFTAYAFQKGYKTEKYEIGTYAIKGDSCFETATFCSQPSKILGKKVHYGYKFQNNELILSGTLPTGMVVEEHWKKIK